MAIHDANLSYYERKHSPNKESVSPPLKDPGKKQWTHSSETTGTMYPPGTTGTMHREYLESSREEQPQGPI